MLKNIDDDLQVLVVIAIAGLLGVFFTLVPPKVERLSDLPSAITLMAGGKWGSKRMQ